jgi:hypothetical protein
MSTKIYTGFKINNINNFEELNQFRKELIIDAKKKQNELSTKLMLLSAIGTLDLYTVGFDVPKKEEIVFNHGYHHVNERFREFKKSNQKDPVYDLRFEIVVFLNNPLLAIFIGDNRNMMKVFENHPNVEYYGYWNNSDGPEDVSDDDWKQREKDWEFLDGALCDEGFIISASDFIMYNFKEDTFDDNLLNLDWKDRCVTAARNIVLNRVDKGLIEIPGKTGEFRHDANIIYNWAYKGDGIKLIENEMKEVEKVLIKNLSYKDVFELRFIDHIQIPRIPK